MPTAAASYFVVVASFEKEDRVESFIATSPELPGLAYIKQGRFYLVYAFATDDAQAASDYARQLRRDNAKYKDSWVHHRKQ